MCGSMADIQSVPAEIRWGKKKKKKKNKLQHENIMVCPIPQGDHKNQNQNIAKSQDTVKITGKSTLISGRNQTSSSLWQAHTPPISSSCSAIPAQLLWESNQNLKFKTCTGLQDHNSQILTLLENDTNTVWMSLVGSLLPVAEILKRGYKNPIPHLKLYQWIEVIFIVTEGLDCFDAE